MGILFSVPWTAFLIGIISKLTEAEKDNYFILGMEGIVNTGTVHPLVIFLSFLASVLKPAAPFLLDFWEGMGQRRY
jgi:hypothetical protein